MSEDPRCCGTGTCIISADGVCWCGQRWDGEKMSFAPVYAAPVTGIAVLCSGCSMNKECPPLPASVCETQVRRCEHCPVQLGLGMR